MITDGVALDPMPGSWAPRMERRGLDGTGTLSESQIRGRAARGEPSRQAPGSASAIS